MGHGSREAYLRDGLRTNPHLVEYARAGMRFWPNYKPQEVSAPPGVTIFRGVQPDTPALDVPREGWPLQISSRRIGKSEVIYCCSTLIFYVKDAETTGDWIGYGSREAHLRDGLGVEPE